MWHNICFSCFIPQQLTCLYFFSGVVKCCSNSCCFQMFFRAKLHFAVVSFWFLKNAKFYLEQGVLKLCVLKNSLLPNTKHPRLQFWGINIALVVDLGLFWVISFHQESLHKVTWHGLIWGMSHVQLNWYSLGRRRDKWYYSLISLSQCRIFICDIYKCQLLSD